MLRLRAPVVVFLLVVACEHKLSREEAAKLLPPATLQCDTKLDGAMVIHEGLTFAAGNKCVDALISAGLISKKNCGIAGANPPPDATCAANLIGAKARYGDGSDSQSVYVRYACGSVTYTVESITTEGAHATISYTGTADGHQLKALGSCATPVGFDAHRTLTGTRDDDGRWTADAK